MCRINTAKDTDFANPYHGGWSRAWPPWAAAWICPSHPQFPYPHATKALQSLPPPGGGGGPGHHQRERGHGDAARQLCAAAPQQPAGPAGARWVGFGRVRSKGVSKSVCHALQFRSGDVIWRTCILAPPLLRPPKPAQPHLWPPAGQRCGVHAPQLKAPSTSTPPCPTPAPPAPPTHTTRSLTLALILSLPSTLTLSPDPNPTHGRPQARRRSTWCA